MDKVARYFDERAESWTQMEQHTKSPVQAAVAIMAGVGEGSRVLDLGCGLGVMIPVYQQLGAARVLGVDVSPNMIELARERWACCPEPERNGQADCPESARDGKTSCPEPARDGQTSCPEPARDGQTSYPESICDSQARCPKIEFLAADAATLQLDERFDSIVIYNAYPHFMDRASLVRTCHELLAEGGRFVVAHGTGRDGINSHHQAVAAGVSLGLAPAREESAAWQDLFAIDAIVDTPGFYAFAGHVATPH